MRRVPDWEERLTAVLAKSFDRPFDDASFNCGLFAAQTIEALTGIALTAGDVQGETEIVVIADRAMAQHGFPEILPSFASIGDIILTDEDRPMLGVCVGEAFWAPGEAGLEMFPMDCAVRAWRI